ncbi:MAG: HAMP domain-containing sensor histidine kinase [Rhodothermales bacterium]|nr:HAMP domain-containing sensor histidine kinase [Rhodothermales bacterium]
MPTDPPAPAVGPTLAPAGADLTGLPARHAPAEGGDRVVADLACVLAHRMRGPVAGIHGYADLLTDILVTDEQRDLALRIFECAAALERMLADLQRYGLDLQPVPSRVPLWPLLRDLAEACGGAEVEAAPDLAVEADPMLLKQLLLILLQNAHDAVEADASAGRVGIRALPGGRRVRIEVWNDGAVPAAARERLFEPFFTTKAQNLGLGLPIARRIARVHGTALEFDPDASGRVRFGLDLRRIGEAAEHI